MTRTITSFNFAVVVAVAMFISACSIANRGRLRNSEEVGRALAALQVSPNYRYWYLYLENSSYAVLGLNREYRFEDIWWTEVESGSEVLGRWSA